MRSTVNSKPRSPSSKPPSKDRRRCICRILPRRRACCSARRSRSGIPSEPSTSPRPRLDLQGQADFAHWKRSCFESERPRLLNVDCEAAEAAAREGLELAEKLGLGPEQGHGLRTLGDIMAAKGDAMKAEELHGLAHAKFRSLGMKRWAERPVAMSRAVQCLHNARTFSGGKSAVRTLPFWRKYPARPSVGGSIRFPPN